MEQIIKQNMFSRTLFNESKLGAYYTDPVHAAKIGRLFRLQGECCVLEPSFGNAEALKVFLSQCERADEAGSVHTFGVELNRETFEQYKQEIEFPVCADFIGGIRASNRAFTLCFANPPYGVGGDDGSTRLEKLFVERIYQLMKTKGYLVLVVSLTTMNLDEFAKCLLARFKPVAFYRFDDKEFEKYKQVVFIGQKRVSIGLYRKEYEEWMIANPGAPLVDIPYIPKDPATRMEVRLNIQSAVDKRMYEAAFRNTETVQYEFQADSNSLRRALSVMNAGAQKVDTVKVSFEGQTMSISDMKNENFVSAIDVKTTAESGECFYEKLSLFMNFLKPYTEDVKIYKGWCIWTKDDENNFIHLVTLHTGPGNQSTKEEETQEEETQEEETEESFEEDSNE